MSDKLPFTAHCTHCKQPFERRRKRDVMFCSDACKQAAYRAVHAQSTEQIVATAETTIRAALDTLAASGESGGFDAIARLIEYASGLLDTARTGSAVDVNAK